MMIVSKTKVGVVFLHKAKGFCEYLKSDFKNINNLIFNVLFALGMEPLSELFIPSVTP